VTKLLTQPEPVDDGNELRSHLFIGVGNAIVAPETNSRYVASGIGLPAERERLILCVDSGYGGGIEFMDTFAFAVP
jgi:hypothetical protein